MNTPYKDVPLSNVDINKLVKQFDEKGANIIQDKDIQPTTPIESIFKDRGHAIVFHKYPNQDVGHWYCLLRNPQKEVFYIDSFGKSPNYYCKNLIPCLKFNKMRSLIVNDLEMQADNSICGRYAVVFCTINKLNQSLPDIYSFLENGRRQCGGYDNFILKLTT